MKGRTTLDLGSAKSQFQIRFLTGSSVEFNREIMLFRFEIAEPPGFRGDFSP